jgi:subtilisin family serine protease
VSKMLTLALSIILSAGTFSMARAQATSLPTYYIYEGAPVQLTIDPNRVAIKTFNLDQKTRSLSSASSSAFEIEATTDMAFAGWSIAESRQASIDPSSANALVEGLAALPEVEFASPVFLHADGTWTVPTRDILVRLRPEHYKTSRSVLATAVSEYEVLEEDFGGMAGAYRLRSNLTNGFAVLELANRLALDARFQWAEPDMIAQTKMHLSPNDPGWNSLWGLRNIGQSGGTVDMDMDCDSAWDISLGDSAIKVLILDDGIQLTHPDLNVAGGADFTGQGGGGNPLNECDGHGTLVAGCVSAIVNNGLGTIGAAPACRVLAARFSISNVPCDGAGTYYVSGFVNALNWGQQQGARVSNNSNGLGVSSSITAKYQETYDAGMVHFASAGNDGVAVIGYPASLSSVNAISAITRTGAKASFSSYGAGLSLTAPGQTIYTTDRTGLLGFGSGDYLSVDGTSFSAPYAAAVAALLLSVDPMLTVGEVETKLHETAMDIGAPGFDTFFGYGLVNALGAIAHARFDIAGDVVLGPAPLTVNFTASTARPAIGWSWGFGDGGGSLEQNPQHEFIEPGLYTVATTLEMVDRSITKTMTNMIAAYADTLVIGDGLVHSTVARVDIDIHNALPLTRIVIPFIYQGPILLRYDSVSISGLRSSAMTRTYVGQDDGAKTASFMLSAPTGGSLEPGTGPVATIWFRSLQPELIDTVPIAIFNDLHDPLNFTTAHGDYVPVTFDGSVIAGCCKGRVGDANKEGATPDEITLADIMLMVDAKFISGDCSRLACVAEADVNQDGGLDPNCADHVTLGDIMILVDHLFISGPENLPLPFCL